LKLVITFHELERKEGLPVPKFMQFRNKALKDQVVPLWSSLLDSIIIILKKFANEE
jgi:hypothetical protein